MQLSLLLSSHDTGHVYRKIHITMILLNRTQSLNENSLESPLRRTRGSLRDYKVPGKSKP